MQTYEELFYQRGAVYDQAMRQFLHARSLEFEQVIVRAKLNSRMVVADVPSGGGYLNAYLPNDCVYLRHEPCASFTHPATTQDYERSALLPLPWSSGSIDVSISLAGVHHLQDKRPLFNELRRVSKPDGRFVLSDVAAGSALS